MQSTEIKNQNLGHVLTNRFSVRRNNLSPTLKGIASHPAGVRNDAGLRGDL